MQFEDADLVPHSVSTRGKRVNTMAFKQLRESHGTNAAGQQLRDYIRASERAGITKVRP
jgi:hypothetical protein